MSPKWTSLSCYRCNGILYINTVIIYKNWYSECHLPSYFFIFLFIYLFIFIYIYTIAVHTHTKMYICIHTAKIMCSKTIVFRNERQQQEAGLTIKKQSLTPEVWCLTQNFSIITFINSNCILKSIIKFRLTIFFQFNYQ